MKETLETIKALNEERRSLLEQVSVIRNANVVVLEA